MILIVDDSSFLRNALKKILEKHGYEIVGMAENGLETITKYKELKPDLVALDIIMPQMNGLETLRLLKSVDPNACVVMVSSMSSKESVTDCIQAGAKNYILKPFVEEKVIEVIQKALSSSALPG
ncbi:MAG: response regulator [Nitrospirae bacterium]|nr:response regulator [Nitrospirota bacterium]